MAFVSLTGWAATQLTNFQITIKGTGAFTYTGSKINVADNAQTQEVEGVHLIVKMANATDALIEGQDYEVVIKDAAGAVVENLINAGTYTVAATGIGNYTGETSPLIFTVDPKPLTALDVQNPEFSVTVTGWDVEPTQNAAGYFNYNGTQKTFTTVVLKDLGIGNEGTALVIGEDKDYTMVYEDNTDATNGTVNNPRIVFTGHGNYQGELEFAFEIKPGPLPVFNETNYTFTKVTTNPIYSGEEVTTTNLPTIVVKSGSTTLTEGTHYVIKWYDANGNEVTKTVNNQQVSSKPVNAGTYTAKVFGYGNYAAGNGLTYTGNDATKAWTLTVEKKALMVYVQDDEKVYDGVAVAVTNNKITGAEIVFNGLLDKDAALKENVTAEFEFAANVNQAKNAGEYTMKAVWADDADITKNYTLSQPTKGTYTIKQRNVKVKAENQTFTYDGTVKAIVTDKNETATAQAIKTVTIQKATVDATTHEITNDEGVIGNDNISDLYEIKLKDGVVIKEKINEAYTGAIEIVDPQPAANNGNPTAEQIAATLAAANYKIVPEAGNVVMNGMDLVLIAGTFSKEYGYEINFDEDFNVVNNAGLKAKDWKVAPTYKVTDEDGNEVNANSGVLPIGTYTIAITNASAIVPESNFEFTEDASHLFTGELTITQKKVEVVINTVSLNTGDGITELRKYATTSYTLVGDDEIAFTLNFADGIADANGKLKAANDYQFDQETGLLLNAVDGTVTVSTAQAPADVKDNANYIITFKKGAINLGGAQSLYLDGDDTQLPGKIEDAAAACAASAATYNVTFSARELKKGEWTTMWLPFNTTVSEVSAALDYAIVDMLVESETSDDMNFRIHMGEIPAYTPFLVKVAETLNLAGVEDDPATANVDESQAAVTFPNVTIVAPIEANMTKENKSYEFKSNLVKQVIGQSFWTTGSKMANDGFEFNKYKATATLKALRAYIIAKEGVTAAPRIFIEEADGTTTAINAVKNEKVANAEGWYTIGGMKLQVAPTQKGIYINNGKKVVVK